MQTQRPLSRRGALVRLGAGGLGAALAARGLAAGAQEATPQGTPAGLPPALAGWVAGWEALDPDRIAAAYAEDGAREDVATGQVQRGREEIRAYLSALFGAFTGLSSTFQSAFAAGDRAAAEWVLAGSYTGLVPGFPPGTGQQLSIRGAAVLELAGGEIVRDTEYFDVFGVLVQLGVVPAPDAGATPAATPAATPTG